MTLKLKQNHITNFSSPKIVGMISVLALILLWGEVKQAQAGCQRFGHSCFGAHGKRAEIPGGGDSLSPPQGESSYPELQYYPGSAGGTDNNRISPYLMDWLMSAHRGQPQFLPVNYGRGAGLTLQEDGLGENRRRK